MNCLVMRKKIISIANDDAMKNFLSELTTNDFNKLANEIADQRASKMAGPFWLGGILGHCLL